MWLLARRLRGSAELFVREALPATASVNFVTAYDGFTLEDLVGFTLKRDIANGEGNRDGHDDNHSDNMGMEGPSDEIGNSQQGNNNAHAQDNPTGWIDWAATDSALSGFVARLVAPRGAHRVLHQRRFLHARLRAVDGLPDVIWRHPAPRGLARPEIPLPLPGAAPRGRGRAVGPLCYFCSIKNGLRAKSHPSGHRTGLDPAARHHPARSRAGAGGAGP